jgi:hypothetical protein
MAPVHAAATATSEKPAMPAPATARQSTSLAAPATTRAAARPLSGRLQAGCRARCVMGLKECAIYFV